ncbi:alpha/beta fold hydrolase, partial [Mycobacterium sp. 1423905.2]|uniref:alpha/beta fold hydrolase n=1 Tax=Mycobacterium sp. 1423905.2 TaxID=1856859 RepID=UPI00080136EA
MKLPDLVLVHGGAHAGDCWDLVIDELSTCEPRLRVLAVDLPGRASNPAPGKTIAQWVDSVVAEIDKASFGDVVIVGHSMGGVIVPGVVGRLGADRVREMILAAAFIPPQGTSIVETLSGPLAPLARAGPWIQRLDRAGRAVTMPRSAARWAFWNAMPADRRRLARSRLYPESVGVIIERVDRCDLPAEVPRTWIMTLRDRALSPAQQQRCISSLGGVDTLVVLDTCHDLMYSEPRRLATILA